MFRYYRDGGPIWFYTGNEASVELYVNATGLMWENAGAAGALLVFAEHRYYGATYIFPGKDQAALPPHQLRLLTMEQALADYATLAEALAANYSDPAVIAFGGSYGGMLAGWLRMKYPAAVAGAIAASAPIMAFGADWDTSRYWEVVTRDATPAAGAAAGCSDSVRRAWPALFGKGTTAAGRAELDATFRLCPGSKLGSSADVTNLAFMMLNAWDTLAMGNFPFPSDYLVFQQTGDARFKIAAWPVRVACTVMQAAVKAAPGETGLLNGMAAAAGVLYNVTKAEKVMYLLRHRPCCLYPFTAPALLLPQSVITAPRLGVLCAWFLPPLFAKRDSFSP